jgi:hypothetical protein
MAQHNVRKILDLKAKRHVSSISSSDERSLITIITCVNVVGMFLPRLVIFPGQKTTADLLDGAPS